MLKRFYWFLLVSLLVFAGNLLRAETAVPRFSTNYMDRTVDPSVDFYHYACGTWLKENPIPSDKARWTAFDQLAQRNWELLHGILDKAAAETAAPIHSPTREVGDFFASAMDTNRLEQLGFTPLREDFARIDSIATTDDLIRLVSAFQLQDIGAMFDSSVAPDDKNSAVYAFFLGQGGLGLPDKQYYLSTNFAKQRTAYRAHVAKMFALAGAKDDSTEILALETTLAKASKDRADLRDPVANYHKFTLAEAERKYPNLALAEFFKAAGVAAPADLVIRQPEFFAALNDLIASRPLDEWKAYLRWHVIRTAAPRLNAAAEQEAFNFYGHVLRGQPEQEPRWQRAARVVDRDIGEALGQLYVDKYFPPEARARMNQLVKNLKEVYRGRLKNVAWMSVTTRAKALAKFARFSQKIGCPARFRDYSSVEIRRDDYLGNVRRAAIFESMRQLKRVGKAVDKSEWEMTPPTVNAYFNSLENEIVFPAGILQPPFFDLTADDPVNYGGIGAVIGHEMTHGYDDEGRQYDAQGNLSDWWTKADAAAFDARAQKLVDQYNAFEALPGLHVNGRLTLGENIADLGGVSIAYEALERDLARHPEKRQNIGGFTPEQRFFLSFAQLWRVNIREAEQRRLITIDPHSPGRFRAIGPLQNRQEFYDAFGIGPGAPMWRAPELRAIIW